MRAVIVPLPGLNHASRWLAGFGAGLLVSITALAATCPAPTPLGAAPTRLVVVVPAIEQSAADWRSFLEKLKGEERSRDLAWLVYDHGVRFLSFGNAAEIANGLDSCIAEKVRAGGYTKVTLIGHSIGGMLARRAYLNASPVEGDATTYGRWAERVDRILLFASVNKGISPEARHFGIPLRPMMWAMRAIPHPRLVLEDMYLGSHFIADLRIAWIRHFGKIRSSGGGGPVVVQFWGSEDSIVGRNDNADLTAFGRVAIEHISGADHGNLHRLEAKYADDAVARWMLYRHHLFESTPPDLQRSYKERRLLFVLRGIRDSANSEWVSDLRTRAEKVYGKENIETPDYDYFSAAQFAVRPIRARNIPHFRDLYAQRLAENPLTEFDFIGHSNGTYILGHSLLSTPSMKFRNVVLAAPVLPTDFNWDRISERHQVNAVRYDVSTGDIPVGILCQALRALGFEDVGPSGVAKFGINSMKSNLQAVAWYDGGHAAALEYREKDKVDNRVHLLNFAVTGSGKSAGVVLEGELGAMRHFSRATPYIVWTTIALLCWWFLRRKLANGISIATVRSLFRVKYLAWTGVGLLSLYAILDVI